MRQERLDGIVNLEDVRQGARRVLPRAIFDAIDGGATDELTLRENRAALDRIWLRPRALADVGQRDISTTVLGKLSWGCADRVEGSASCNRRSPVAADDEQGRTQLATV